MKTSTRYSGASAISSIDSNPLFSLHLEVPSDRLRDRFIVNAQLACDSVHAQPQLLELNGLLRNPLVLRRRGSIQQSDFKWLFC